MALSSDDQYAFVADFNDGLDIINVSDVTDPWLDANLDTSGQAYSVTLSSDGQYAFVADGNGGLDIINVSDPDAATSVGTFNTYDAQGVALSSDGQYAFVADYGGSLKIISLGSECSILFGGTVDGGYSLSTNGTTSFAGVVGGTDSLANLTTDGGGVSFAGNVTTTGNQSFGGEATLVGDTTFTGDDVSISGLNGGGLNVTFSATSTTLDANAYSVANVADLTVSGDVGLNGTIATTGNQSYGGDVGLLGPTALTAGAGAISLGVYGEVEGASHSLTIGDANQTGDVTLGGASAVTLGGLNVAAGNFNLAINAGASQAVKVSSPVDILSTGVLTVTSNVASIHSYVSFDDGLNATAPSEVRLDGSINTDVMPINLSHLTLIGDGSQPSLLLTTGISVFSGGPITIASLDTGIGMLSYHAGTIGSLTVQGDANIGVGLSGTGIDGSGDLNINGNATVGSNVIVHHGDQNYAENVTLTGDVNFEGNTAKFTNGVLGGDHDLTFNFTQTATVHSFQNVANFTSIGNAEVNGTVYTTGFQKYKGNVALNGDTTLAATTVEFAGSCHWQRS